MVRPVTYICSGLTGGKAFRTVLSRGVGGARGNREWHRLKSKSRQGKRKEKREAAGSEGGDSERKGGSGSGSGVGSSGDVEGEGDGSLGDGEGDEEQEEQEEQEEERETPEEKAARLAEIGRAKAEILRKTIEDAMSKISDAALDEKPPRR